MERKWVDLTGWVASLLGGAMFLSYIDQIRLNLSGQPGSIILPVVTVANCLMWAIYGLTKEKRDWPIVTCNAVGIVTATITAITAIIGKI